MKRPIAVLVLITDPMIAFAADIPPKVLTLVGKIYVVILNPLIALLFAASFTYFLYGIVKFVWNGDSPEVRETGKRALLWGIIGMFIMFSVFGILRLLVNTIGGDSGAALNTV